MTTPASRVTAEKSEVHTPGLPMLTNAMIYAAAVGHYGKKRVDATGTAGIAMTVDGQDYNFDKAFRRMWSGVRAHLRAEGRS